MEETTEQGGNRSDPGVIVERDNRVEKALREKGPMTQEELSRTLELSDTLTYQSLNRLRNQERAHYSRKSKDTTLWAVQERKRKRGRPRPTENIERDNRIEKILQEKGPMTRNDLADLIRLSYSLTYLALDRLRKQGRVRRCLQDRGLTVWTTEVETPCP